jgi:uncharacterized protein
MDKLFPAGLAEGSAFCNRQIEKARLQYNIDNTIHTLIISPRRYGKTSLVLEGLHTKKIPYAYVQFFNAFRDDLVLKRFVNGFGDLLSELIPMSKRALQAIGKLIKHARMVVKTQGMELNIGLEPIANDPLHIIEGLLNDIESVLKSKKKQAVIFLDEFQDVINSDISSELQSILRDFIQKTCHITFIISGSNRRMLLKLFDDRSKPFYKLFDRIILNRITKEHYVPFLQKLANKKWQKPLADDVIRRVFQYTEFHAYYLNRLCQKLWSLPQIPKLQNVEECWQALAEEEFSTIASDLSALTKNQRLVLQSMSKYEVLKAPTGIAFLNDVGLAHRSVSLCITSLEHSDFIEVINNGYRIIDPMMKYILLS